MTTPAWGRRPRALGEVIRRSLIRRLQPAVPLTAGNEGITPGAGATRSPNQFTSAFMIGRTTLRSRSASGSSKGRFIRER